MKIIGQSTIVNKPNYFHLAYTAATTRKLESSLFSAASIVFLTGCILSFKLTKSGDNKLHSKIVLRKGNRVKLEFGFLCLLAGCVLFFLSYKYGKSKYLNPGSVTYVHMLSLSHEIEKDLSEKGSFPEDVVTLPELADWKTVSVKSHDAWSNPIQLHKNIEDGQPVYKLISAGKDGEFETKDDIGASPITSKLITDRRIQIISYLITQRLKKGESIPENIADFMDLDELKMNAVVIQDGWTNQMLLKKLIDGEKTEYSVISAGADKVFDTEDDIASKPIIVKEKGS